MLPCKLQLGLAVLCEPFLPFTSAKLKGILNMDASLSWNDIATKEVLLKASIRYTKLSYCLLKLKTKKLKHN